ncbi:hypothetical protein LCGC14_1505930 [marine sediment metagenome]|uniref:Lipoprotein n=1 Tax=marine sediment metagenome TaxID=412755 RepID=A0A0F9LI25_9ZZZZ
MKTSIIAICLMFVVGCTTPTQRIASQSLQRGVDQQHTVFYDMSRIARQELLNAGAAAAVIAAENQDATAAQAVVKEVFDKMNNIDWLHIQWERSRTLVRMGQQYIWSQQGVFDILKKEWEEAAKRAKTEQPN